MSTIDANQKTGFLLRKGEKVDVVASAQAIVFRNRGGELVEKYVVAAAETKTFGPYYFDFHISLHAAPGPVTYTISEATDYDSAVSELSSAAGLTPEQVVGQLKRNYAGKRFGALGDSISADAKALNATNAYWTSWGFLTWLRRVCGNRIDLPLSRVYAVGGNTAAQVLAEQVPLAVADSLDYAIVHMGINSLGSVTTAALISTFRQTYRALLDSGAKVIAIPIRVKASGAAITGDNLLQMTQVNRWIVEYCRVTPNMYCLDVNQNYMDFSTGNAIATYLRDNLHDNQISAEMMGTVLGGYINALLPASTTAFTLLGDLYDATKNPTGNCLANGNMIGSSGTVVNGATGTPPTSWRGQKSPGGTVTAAFSQAADSTYPTLGNAVITIGGTADQNTVALEQAPQGKFSAGDLVTFEAEVEYTLSTANIVAIGASVDFRTAGFVSLAVCYDGYPTAANGMLAAETKTIFLKTEPFIVPATTDYIDCQVFCATGSSGAVTAVLKVKRASLRKIIDTAIQ